MDRRELLRQSVALAVSGSALSILAGCGGGNDDSSPTTYSEIFPTLSFANHDAAYDLLDAAVLRHEVSPVFTQIVDQVNPAVTPAQKAYIDSLDLGTGTEEEVLAKAEAFVDSLVHQGEDGLYVFTPPDVFANDMERFAQLFDTLPLKGGMPDAGPPEVVSIDKNGHLTTQPAASQSHPPLSSLSSNSMGKSRPLQAQNLNGCTTQIFQVWILALVVTYLVQCRTQSLALRAGSPDPPGLIILERYRWDPYWYILLILICVWVIIVRWQLLVFNFAVTTCTEHDQGGFQ